MRVEAPDGRVWKVERRWVPKRPRLPRRRDIDVDPFWALDLSDVSVSGVLLAVVLIVVVVALLIVAWPILALAIEIVLLGFVLVGGVIGRFVFGRPWRIVARSDAEELAWDVRGWRASREAIDVVARDLRLGTEPRPPAAVRLGSGA